MSKPTKVITEVITYSRVVLIKGVVVGHLDLINNEWKYRGINYCLLTTDQLQSIVDEINRLNLLKKDDQC